MDVAIQKGPRSGYPHLTCVNLHACSCTLTHAAFSPNLCLNPSQTLLVLMLNPDLSSKPALGTQYLFSEANTGKLRKPRSLSCKSTR